jgi:hypothetical protein
MMKADQRGNDYVPFPPTVIISTLFPGYYPKEKKIKPPLPQKEKAEGGQDMTIGCGVGDASRCGSRK